MIGGDWGEWRFPYDSCNTRLVSTGPWPSATRATEQLAIAAAETPDERLANYPPALLEEIYAYNKRWVVRALHRGEHLDEVAAGLNNGQ